MRCVAPLLAGLLLVAACGGPSADPADSTAAPNPPTEAPSTVVAASTSLPPTTSVEIDVTDLPDRSVVTQEDNGSTFSTTLGNRVELQLSNDYLWSAPETSGPAQLVPVNHFDDPGFTSWEVLIEESGTVIITARGEPNCDDADCVLEDMAFRVTIEVAAG